ncbi:MAG: sugar phosphate isomerase/epimerase family protein [Paracoccaceae bacterium]
MRSNLSDTPFRARYASRLNSFASAPDLFWDGKTDKPDVADLVKRAATVSGLTHLDLNYPDHAAGAGAETVRIARDNGLEINGFAMRYYTDPGFKRGAFSNPDAAVRRKAIDLTKAGMDAAAAAGVNLMTIWLGQDGFDTPFQADYAQLWDWEVAGLREVADHIPTMDVSVEYKPNEPRAFALLPDATTTLLAIADAGSPNLGVTLDFAHMLYANEQPAYAAMLVAKRARVLGVHLNDGYAKRDDGLMVGAVHSLQTIELLRRIRADGYDGVIYFDTFPDFTGLDPVAECEANIMVVESMLDIIDRIDADNGLAAAVAAQDGIAAQRIVQQCMFHR